jgi:hypothetical protein
MAFLLSFSSSPSSAKLQSTVPGLRMPMSVKIGQDFEVASSLNDVNETPLSVVFSFAHATTCSSLILALRRAW